MLICNHYQWDQSTRIKCVLNHRATFDAHSRLRLCSRQHVIPSGPSKPSTREGSGIDQTARCAHCSVYNNIKPSKHTSVIEVDECAAVWHRVVASHKVLTGSSVDWHCVPLVFRHAKLIFIFCCSFCKMSSDEHFDLWSEEPEANRSVLEPRAMKPGTLSRAATLGPDGSPTRFSFQTAATKHLSLFILAGFWHFVCIWPTQGYAFPWWECILTDSELWLAFTFGERTGRLSNVTYHNIR